MMAIYDYHHVKKQNKNNNQTPRQCFTDPTLRNAVLSSSAHKT